MASVSNGKSSPNCKKIVSKTKTAILMLKPVGKSWVLFCDLPRSKPVLYGKIGCLKC